jgi:hypothetical protein
MNDWTHFQDVRESNAALDRHVTIGCADAIRSDTVRLQPVAGGREYPQSKI